MMKAESTAPPLVGSYALAGWLAIASAVLMIPQIILVLAIEYFFGKYAAWKLAFSTLNTVGVFIGVYVLYMFKELLNRRFRFHQTDTMIMILIGFTVASFLVGAAGLIPDLELIGGIVGIALMIPFGIITILFGVFLLKLNDDLFGLLKPYAYLEIASGIGAATIILAPIGVLFAIGALIMQGMIFLRAHEEEQYL